jgi:hypothetical protein
MKKYIISLHSGISGSFINMLDYSNYLCKNFNYKLYWINGRNDNFYSLYKQTFREYKNLQFIKFQRTRKIITATNIVTDFVSLIKLKRDKYFINCKNLYVLDNLELILFLRKIKDNIHISRFENFIWKYETLFDFFNSIGHYDNLKFMITPFILKEFNLQNTDKEKFIPYYKKIDIQALQIIKTKPIKKCFSREYINDNVEYLPKLYGINPFQYECYYYKHRQELSYIEMFGRLIFEFIIMDRKVKFDENLLQYNDGLLDYIKHYGLKKDKLIKEIGDWNESWIFSQ